MAQMAELAKCGNCISAIRHFGHLGHFATAGYLDSLCPVCFRQNRQNLLKASRSELFFRFLVVL
jgi:hypothetical protein